MPSIHNTELLDEWLRHIGQEAQEDPLRYNQSFFEEEGRPGEARIHSPC